VLRGSEFFAVDGKAPGANPPGAGGEALPLTATIVSRLAERRTGSSAQERDYA